MKTCYSCGVGVKKSVVVKQGVSLSCLKCPKCGEEYYTSSELIKFDIKTGNRDMIRKFGTVGDSMVMRFPTKVLKQYEIKSGDYGVLEPRADGILIRPVHAKDIEG